MAAIQVGRKCVKLAGRGAGEEVVVTQVIDKNFVKIKNSKGREARCNVRHLEPL